MKKSIIIGGTILALSLALGACGSNDSNTKDDNSATTSESTTKSESPVVGEIIGSNTVPAAKIVDVVTPGDSVTFEIPSTKTTEYLHFAFMYGKSGSKGWFFAPESENGITLSKSMFDSGKAVDITKDIKIFAAPVATAVNTVTADDGDLKYGDSDKFMTATVTKKDDMYEVKINNLSADLYETPFSAGVWKTTEMEEKDFDHTPSAELSTLATTGNRTDLYATVKK